MQLFVYLSSSVKGPFYNVHSTLCSIDDGLRKVVSISSFDIIASRVVVFWIEYNTDDEGIFALAENRLK